MDRNDISVHVAQSSCPEFIAWASRVTDLAKLFLKMGTVCEELLKEDLRALAGYGRLRGTNQFLDSGHFGALTLTRL
jgi:hypothetical protein